MNKLKSNKRLARRYMAIWAAAIVLANVLPATAAATGATGTTGGDPLTIVNNLSTFIFSCIKAIGIIVLGWGVVQVGMSVQSHDASQRTQGFLCLFGGLLITFAKEILSTIGAV